MIIQTGQQTHMEIKKLGFGLMRLPTAENPEWRNVDLDNMKEFVPLNEATRYGKQGFVWNYGEEKKKGGSPADCVECGACQGHCPQKIQIIEKLKTVVSTFEA